MKSNSIVQRPTGLLAKKIIAFGVVILLYMLISLIFGSSKTYASSCGISTGSIHDYAGLIVNVQIEPGDGGSIYEANHVDVRVDTHGATTTPPGGLINLNTGTHHEKELFNQKSTGCSFKDGHVVVLGYGGSSSDTDGASSNWALDCDNSKRAGTTLNPYQAFEVSGVTGTLPSGVRSGGYWTGNIYGTLGQGEADQGGARDSDGNVISHSDHYPVVVAPPNGETKFVNLIYHEPAKPPHHDPPPTPDPNAGISATCTTVVGKVHDENAAGHKNAKYIRVFKGVPGSLGEEVGSGNLISGGITSGSGTIIPYGSTYPNDAWYSFNLNGSDYFGDGGTAQSLTVKTYSVRTGTSAPFTFSSDNGAGDTTTVQLDCADNAPALSFTATCKQVNFGSLHDDDDINGDGISYYGEIFAKNADGSAGQRLTTISGRGYDNKDVNFDIGTNVPSNYGLYINVGVTNIKPISSGGGDGDFGSVQTVKTGPCFSATCQLLVEGNVPGGSSAYATSSDVKANSSFRLRALVTNNGSLPLPSVMSGKTLAFSAGSGSNNSDVGFSGTNPAINAPIDPGNTATMDVDLSAGASGSKAIKAYPDYYGVFGMGGCEATANIYQRFNLTPVASMSGDDEQPVSVSYTTGINNSSASVSAATTSEYYVLPAGSSVHSSKAGPSSTSGPWPTGATNTMNATSAVNFAFAAGVQFCSQIDLTSINQGWVGPGSAKLGTSNHTTDDVNGNPTPNSAKQCFMVRNQPYVHMTGGDVFSGGGFGPSCTPPSAAYSGIKTYDKTSGNQPRGSGSQFAALSMDEIRGFSSANIRDFVSGSTPKGSTGLNFGNSGAGSVPNDGNVLTDHAILTGGNYGISNACFMPDYYSQKPTGATTYANEDLGTTGTHSYKATGNVTIPTTNVANGANNAIYVDGDVNITGDIKFSGADAAGGYGVVKDIPSLLIIAKGNISIDPGVKQLDGIFIAQPDSSNAKGTINTCVARTFAACKDQLVINGAFIASKVFLNRTYSSLRFSQQAESKIYGAGTHNCTDGTATPSYHTDDQDCAAEIFNYSPEVFMSQPAITPNNQGKYQSYISLSPVL